MLAVLRGEAVDRVPWVPRLDLWHKANRRAETLPARFAGASLMEMTDELGWGCHAVIPDFQDLRGPEDDADRALGIYNLHCMPYRTVLERVTRTIRKDGDRTRVEYRTPVGTLRTETVHDESMRAAGITIAHVSRYPFTGPADYEPLRWLFEHARVEANYDGYQAHAEAVGERGFAVAYVSSAASPMHLVQRELMPMATFFYEMHDRPDELARLAGSVAAYWRQVLDVSAGCPAEVLLLGANYDASLQYPPFFAEHLTPWLRRFADRLHERGKFLLTHTDGENDGLLGEYLAAGIDVADSICPAPMTRLTLADVREAFGGRITIMGGVPSVALLPEAMDEADFESFCDDLFAQVGDGRKLILGIYDTTPPAADFSRIERLAERVEQLRPAT